MTSKVEVNKSEPKGNGGGCIMIFFILVGAFGIGMDVFLRKVFELSEQYISKCG